MPRILANFKNHREVDRHTLCKSGLSFLLYGGLLLLAQTIPLLHPTLGWNIIRIRSMKHRKEGGDARDGSCSTLVGWMVAMWKVAKGRSRREEREKVRGKLICHS
jgi:hypothetical protein